mgnify:CR=1 FL=1
MGLLESAGGDLEDHARIGSSVITRGMSLSGQEPLPLKLFDGHTRFSPRMVVRLDESYPLQARQPSSTSSPAFVFSPSSDFWSERSSSTSRCQPPCCNDSRLSTCFFRATRERPPHQSTVLISNDPAQTVNYSLITFLVIPVINTDDTGKTDHTMQRQVTAVMELNFNNPMLGSAR